MESTNLEFLRGSELKSLIKEHSLAKLLKIGEFALEREMIRTNHTEVAKTKHPKELGNKSCNSYITTDFGEQQIELITPIFSTISQLVNFSEGLYTLVAQNIGDELLWPNSMPPILPEKIEYAKFNDKSDNEAYRNYLVERYGPKVQMISGIHFNFSFTPEFIQTLYRVSASKKTRMEFRDEIYLKITRNYHQIKHLIIALTAATPNCHESFDKVVGRSIRNSKYGYRNFEELNLSYESTRCHVSDVYNYVKEGVIEGFREVYKSIRLKGLEVAYDSDIVKTGIRYLEFRDLDINPFHKSGIDEKDLHFLHLVILYLLCTEELAPHDYDDSICLESSNRALDFELNEFFQKLCEFNRELSLGFEDVIAYKIKQYQTQQLPYQLLEQEDYLDFNLSLAKKYKAEALETFSLKGYEDLELSTQIILKEAILNNLKFEVIDNVENLIKISNNFKEEYLFQATKTSLDNYASVLLMENKLATKHVLREYKMKVPKGDDFTSMELALIYAQNFQGGFVIKPNKTNFGLGISIFENGYNEDVREALEIAFTYDDNILIEEFVSGKEYRFLVINGRVEAVLHREPANIIGDGEHTIAELVALKNQDSLRGEHGYTKPLKNIVIDEHVIIYLKEKGYSPTSIISAGEKIFLRQNSNISTGGDSIDLTDHVAEEYKEVAVSCASALKANITGIDIIIPGEIDVFTNYCIIEANFNPAIHIHTYPYEGRGRNVGRKILKTLELI